MIILALIVMNALVLANADPSIAAEPPKLMDDEHRVGAGPSVPLFDGKSLEGWRGDEKFWSVENGEIVGRSTAENPCTTTTYLHHPGTFAELLDCFER